MSCEPPQVPSRRGHAITRGALILWGLSLAVWMLGAVAPDDDWFFWLLTGVHLFSYALAGLGVWLRARDANLSLRDSAKEVVRGIWDLASLEP